MTLYQKFVSNPTRKVTLDGVEQENIFGYNATTHEGAARGSGGYYKNGFTASTPKSGNNGKFNYITIKVYTVVKGYVDIEEVYMLRDDDKIVQRKGWTIPPLYKTRVDLLRLDNASGHESYNDLKHLYNLPNF